MDESIFCSVDLLCQKYCCLIYFSCFLVGVVINLIKVISFGLNGKSVTLIVVKSFHTKIKINQLNFTQFFNPGWFCSCSFAIMILLFLKRSTVCKIISVLTHSFFTLYYIVLLLSFSYAFCLLWMCLFFGSCTLCSYVLVHSKSSLWKCFFVCKMWHYHKLHIVLVCYHSVAIRPWLPYTTTLHILGIWKLIISGYLFAYMKILATNAKSYYATNCFQADRP